MKKLILFFLFLALFSCKKNPHAYTFYYWRTQLSLNMVEKTALNKATTPYIYTRFFDVDKTNEKFEPVAVIKNQNTFETKKQIIPVIFITNRTFINIKKEEINFLAEGISTLIEKKYKEFGFKNYSEIQIDCDWTAGTRDDYFNFLKQLKTVSGKEITSTLRLHQVKDKKVMGIPPVSKVYLMCYSTSSPLENSGKNSILDLQLMENYLADLDKYPIKNIDVALPLYSWGIVTNYAGKHKLINALSKKDLQHAEFKKISDSEAEILNDGFYFGNYMNKGFRIKIEEIEETTLDEAVNFLNKKISQYHIIYYQLDHNFVENRNFIR